MALSDKEIQQLLEKARLYREIKGEDLPYLEQALDCFNQIIKNVSPHPHYFSERSEVKFRLSGQLNRDDLLDSAVEDINKAIELDPDEGFYYYKRGFYLWCKLDKKNISDSKKNNQPWEIVTADFKSSLSRDPTYPQVWLDLITINIVYHNWDDAISLYGQCKPYISDKDDQLIRSYLGCLALIFAGEPIEEEDVKPLYDQAIRLNRLLSRESRIISFLNKIHEKEYHKEKWDKATEITKLFIDHCENPGDRSEKLKKLGLYEEALIACEKAIEQDSNYISAWFDKGWILGGQLKCYEEALEAIDKVIELRPDHVVAWVNKGWNLGKLKRYEEALKAIDKATELRPDYADAWYNKGWILDELNRHEEAIKAYDKATELKPNDT